MDRLGRACAFGAGVLAMALLLEGHLFASLAPAAPELDGSSVPVALGVLAAGVLLLRARSQVK